MSGALAKDIKLGNYHVCVSSTAISFIVLIITCILDDVTGSVDLTGVIRIIVTHVVGTSGSILESVGGGGREGGEVTWHFNERSEKSTSGII